MSAVFERATDRSRTEPVISPASESARCRRCYGRGFEAGDRYGYVRGLQIGAAIAGSLAICAVAVLKVAGVL